MFFSLSFSVSTLFSLFPSLRLCSSSTPSDVYVWQISFSFLYYRTKYTTDVYKSWMSFCYANDKITDQVSSQRQYLTVMPESQLQHKLSSNNSTTTGHVRYVQRRTKKIPKREERKEKRERCFFSACVRMCVCRMNGVWQIVKKRIFLVRHELNWNTIYKTHVCACARARALIHICIKFLFCSSSAYTYWLQFSLATNIEKEKKNRSTCMSSLLQFILCVDRQMDRQAVSILDE